MIIFWIISALMLVIALLFVVLPLWRGNYKDSAVERKSANLEIFRDQIAEMDADLRNGLLTQEMHEQGKRELQSRLLDEVGEDGTAGTTAVRNPLRVLALVLSVVLPVIAVGVYWKVGSPDALLQKDRVVSAEGFDNVRSEASLRALEAELAANPDDAESLLLLARSYSDRERFAEAAQVYDKLTRLMPKEAQLWADYADVLAMASGRTLVGTPTKLLNKALELEPNNFKALALSGSAAMERGDYAATVTYWEKLLNMIPKEDENARIVESGIQQARVLMAQKNGAKPPAKNSSAVENERQQSGKESITGTVVLSASLKAKASPDDTVFVLVRAAEGPKMPLAIVRKQVKDLPFKFTLDDSTAMSPQMKMSNFDQVVVIARVSKSGNAMTQPGDLQGMSATLKPGSKGIKLNIDTVIQ
ncbi:MAG: c-type cytochrome biogenesis protein CcmI [Gallionellales bacterium 35-53-114]|nr:MAG: c-type cytochrome biogenesis protein CcmI [Gallionellales bacterium 35-53-114]OYZ65179.1 MAG: c-type cytochrome biogenesis protein CcmI [Gallionellales bacterium 24-53-125]OZB08086.1 MAG: c-type cytochrome biogenesis protein CcmI [Gallionellales bacterium 39-52-133]HQS58005.1 c-type cytochrome biogenesis protein CcmI [Gallionellaceae bacterium]HQS73561.1 c-type cytochrome biogenesis protein CcmI [Gallionellaceae bacterium]